MLRTTAIGRFVSSANLISCGSTDASSEAQRSGWSIIMYVVLSVGQTLCSARAKLANLSCLLRTAYGSRRPSLARCVADVIVTARDDLASECRLACTMRRARPAAVSGGNSVRLRRCFGGCFGVLASSPVRPSFGSSDGAEEDEL